MATPTFLRNFPVRKEQSVLDDGTNKGNGNDKHIPLGKDNSGNVYRELLAFTLDWSNVYQIVAAYLVYKSTDQTYHIAKGSNGAFEARRISAAWSMGGGSEGSWSASAPTVYGDASVAGSTYATGTLPQTGGTIGRLDITGLVEDWAPSTGPSKVLKSDGSTPGGGESNHGLRLRSTNEADTTYKYEIFESLREPTEGRKPYIELVYISNIPPNAPTVTSPTTGDPTTVASTDADSLTVEFTFSDQDAANTCQRVELEVYGDGATDGAPGTRLATTGAIAPTALGPLNAFSVTITGLSPRTNQRYRLRTQDSDDSWGPWTSLANGRIFTAYKVGAPLQSQMETTPDSPHVYGSLNSQDTSDYISGWEGEFYRDTQAGSVTLWAEGIKGIGGTSTRSDVEWGGSVLNAGDIVRWRHRHKNRDGVVGDWSTWRQTTIRAEVGPDAMSPIDTSTKLLTRTPGLTIGHSASFDGYQWRLYRSGVLLYDSGLVTVSATTSTLVTVPAGLLDWGDGSEALPLEWDAAVQLVGNSGVGTFSPRRPIRINSLPSTTLSIEDLMSSGYVDTSDPTYVAPYDDLDRQAYGEWPDVKEYEIRLGATPAGSGALVKHVTDNTSPVESEQLGATFVPSSDQAYDIRVRYRDDATVKVSTTLAANSVAGATNVKVASVSGLAVGDWLTLESGTSDEEARQITIVGTAGSGGTGVTVDHGYTLAHTSADAVDVHYWGPWTNWLTFTYAAPPVVAANLPADSSVVNDPTRSLSWTFTSTQTQDHAVISVYERVAGVDELIWEETQSGTAVSWDIPAFLIGTGKTYAWEVEGFDANGLSATSTRRTFTTSFTQPTALTGLATSADAAESAVTVSWDGYVNDVLVTPGLVEFWPTPASPMAGVMGLANLTVVGTPVLNAASIVPGEPTYDAVTVDDTDSLEVASAPSGMKVGDTWSYEVWVYRTDATGSDFIMATYGGTDDGMDVMMMSSGMLRVRRRPSGPLDFQSATGVISTNTLHHIVVTHSPGDMKVYVDGAEVADTVNDPQVYGDGWTIFSVAHLNLGIVGTLQFPAWYSTQLSADTVKRHYLKGAATGASTDPYLHHYRVWWQTADGVWMRVDGGPEALGDGKTPLTAASFEHVGARFGEDEYRVEVHNGAQASDPAYVSGSLDPALTGRWAFAIPGGDILEMRASRAPRRTSDIHERFDPPGRGASLHLSWGAGPRSITLSVRSRPSVDGDLSSVLAALLVSDTAGWLKAPAGWDWEPMWARVTDLSETPQTGGMLVISATFEATEED